MRNEYDKGKYKWHVKSGRKVYVHEFDLKEPRNHGANDINVSLENEGLKIDVSPHRLFPLTFFVRDHSGGYLDYYYWEPNPEMPQKVFDLGQYESAVVQFEILQSGELLFSKKIEI